MWSKCKEAHRELDVIQIVRWPDTLDFQGQVLFWVTYPRLELSLEISQILTVDLKTLSGIDAAAVILVAHRLLQYHLRPNAGCNDRVALSMFLFIYSKDRRRSKLLFLRAKEEPSQSWSVLMANFTDSDVYCHGVAVLYRLPCDCSTLFYDVAMF